MNISQYITRMQEFRAWLNYRWSAYGQGIKPMPTVRAAAKRFNIRFDYVIMMCEDANAHGFNVSVSANDNVGDRIIELI